MNPLFYFHIQNANYDGNSVVMDLVNTSNMNRAIINNSASGSHIGYDRVEEIISHVDSNSPDNGKIVTEFYNKPNDKIGSGYSGQVGLAVDVPPINFEEYNGRILKQETFNRNGVIKLREQRDYLYRNLGLVYAFKVYYAVISSVINGGQSSYGLNKFKNSLILGYSNYNYPSSSLTYTLPYDYYPYRIFTRYSLASRITRTEFSDSGDETITIIDQGYNEKDRLASTEFTNSEGEIVKSEYFYPYDTEYSVNSYSRMSSLVARNSIMNPVYSRNYLDNQLLGHELTAYDFFNGNLRPLNIAFQKQDAPLDQIEKRIEYLEYDVNGNPTLSKKDGGPLTQLLWGYEYTYPIAKIDNVDENSTPINEILDEAVISNSTSNDSEIEQELLKIRQHPDYENSLMSSHTYNILAGMTTNTDSRGHRTSFHYDDRERLIEIKDDDSHLLEDYEYDLAYETADCLEGCTNTVSLSTSDYQVFRNQNFTISYSISGTFTIARWELWYGDDTFQNGTGVPAGLSHSYGSDESYGLKPIRLFLYDSNDTLITGNINVRLSPGNIPGGDVYFGNISSQNSNPLSARIYADPGSEITYSISVGAGGNVNAMSTSVAVGGQSNQLAAYESQNNTIVVPAQGYIDCTIATTLNGADFANITLTIQGTDRGQVVSPSSVLQSISN
ncbi:MAG: hypothetical protein CMH48_09940 [Muricauda sp.]|nr:hypothetical protein [Allomuricauda sp.]